MTATMESVYLPAHLRDHTQVTSVRKVGNLVRVRTRPWNRERFFLWLQEEMESADPPIPHLGRLAEMAGLSPSTISNWKTGKQRPKLEGLTAIAKVLGKPRAQVWLTAGLVGSDDVGGDGQQPVSEDELLADLINSSKVLSPEKKQRLIASELASAAREREQRRRRVKEQIDLWEQP